MREIPYDIIRKKACDNTDKLCYHLKPYSMVDIAQNKKLTKKEKELNVKRYQTSCSNRSGIIQKCCSKNKKDIEKLDKLLRKLNKPAIYGKPSYNQQGELESIKICTKDKLKECGDGFRKLNSYEMCKIPEDVNLDIVDGKTLDSFVRDCHMAQCNPQEKLAAIDGTYDEDYTFEFDKQVSAAIRKNELTNLKHHLQEDAQLINRVLTSSAEGNSIYHEAFKHDAKHIIVYLFKTITQEAINRLNSQGETLLHMAMKTDNPNAVEMCLRLGANINAVNNLGETPIFNAVRNNQYQNVVVSVNKYADIYHKNKKGQTIFIVACTVPKRNIDIVRLLVENGSSIDDKTTEDKTILQHLLEKEELNEQKLTKENKEAKEKLDLNIEDEKIRTYLQNLKIKNMDMDLSKELSVEDTKKLEGILYILSDKDKFPNRKANFTMKVNYDENLKYPDDLHYPKEVDGSDMKPYNIGDMNFSHEPYFLKYKDMHKGSLTKLKKIIQLTKWDGNNSQDKKLQIIDDIMTGKISFDSYRYKVYHENGITQEQDHLLDNIDEKTLFDFKNPEDSKKIVQLKATRKEDEIGETTDTPFNINHKTEHELDKQASLEDIRKVLDTELQRDYEALMASPSVSSEEKEELVGVVRKIINQLTGGALDKQEKIKMLKAQLEGKTYEVKERMTLKEASNNQNVLLAVGIGIAVIVLIIFLYLAKNKKLPINFNSLVRKYGG